MTARHCMVCKAKPAKRIKSRYKYAAEEAIFCTLRCGAEWGLLAAGGMGLGAAHFCTVENSWTTMQEGEYCDKCWSSGEPREQCDAGNLSEEDADE